jgi:hypothetical protein
MVARQAVDEDRFCETITQAADKIFVFINPGKPFSTQKQILNLKNAEKLTVIFHSWFCTIKQEDTYKMLTNGIFLL